MNMTQKIEVFKLAASGTILLLAIVAIVILYNLTANILLAIEAISRVF